MTLYQNKYRIETTRRKDWNYASDGWYFITICTKGRDLILGIIEHGTMHLSEYGRIVEQCWFGLPAHYSNLILDEFVVMPDHIHGIMIIDNTREPVIPGDCDVGVPGDCDGGVPGDCDVGVVETGFKPVSTPTRHGLFEFVRALKTFSSRQMNELDKTPGKPRWQTRFHDRIIRDEQELNRIRQYIINNPLTWEKDSLK